MPIIADNFLVNESRRLNIAASVLEGMDMVDKKTDELGGLIYKGPEVYEEFEQAQWNFYDTKYDLKRVKLALSHVNVKEEHRYPIKPPCFKLNLITKPDIPHVPKELADDAGIQRSIINYGKVCRCGSTKNLNTPLKIIRRRSGKVQEVKRGKVWTGGKQRSRCKKCTGCLAKKCNKCNYCRLPHLKKPCVDRKCLFPTIPKCPCFI